MSLSRLNEISGGCEKIGLAGFLKIMRSYYKQRDKFGIAVLIYFILCYICSSYQNTQNHYRRNDSLNIYPRPRLALLLTIWWLVDSAIVV